MLLKRYKKKGKILFKRISVKQVSRKNYCYSCIYYDYYYSCSLLKKDEKFRDLCFNEYDKYVKNKSNLIYKPVYDY